MSGRLPTYNYGRYSSSSHSPRYDESYSEDGSRHRYNQIHPPSESTEPLFYNSRPRHYKEHRRRKHTWDYEDSQDGWYSDGYDYYGVSSDQGKVCSDSEYCSSYTTNLASNKGTYRRPSLERQRTLYDEHPHTINNYVTNRKEEDATNTYPECHTDIRYNEYYGTIVGYNYPDERYEQSEGDGQWNGKEKWFPGPITYYENKRSRKLLPQRPASSIGIHWPDYRPAVTRQRSYESEEVDYSGYSRRQRPSQTLRHSMSRQPGTGKKLPPTPTKLSRQLPKARQSSEDNYYKSDYNEDYNYAYRSQDNLPQDSYIESAYSGQEQNTCKTDYPEITQEPHYMIGYIPADQHHSVYDKSCEKPQAQNTYDGTFIQNTYNDTYQQSGEIHKNNKVSDQYDTQYNILSSTSNNDMFQESYKQIEYSLQDNHQNQVYDTQSIGDYEAPYVESEDTTSLFKNGYEGQYFQPEGTYLNQFQDNFVTYNDQDQNDISAVSHIRPSDQKEINGHQPGDFEYFFSHKSNEDIAPLGVSKRKKLDQYDEDLYNYANNESLERTDNELARSTDTMMDSADIDNSQLKKDLDNYSVAADTSPTKNNQIESAPNAMIVPSSTTTITTAPPMTNHVIDNHTPISSVTITAMVHTTTTQADSKHLIKTESYQEDVVTEEYPETNSVPIEPRRKDSQLSQQSQISQHSNHSHKGKLTRGDSYASDRFAEESYSPRDSYLELAARDSFSSVTKDDYKSPLTRTDSYQKREHPRTTVHNQNFSTPEPISRAESYQRGYFKDDETVDERDTPLGSGVNEDYKIQDELPERYERDEDFIRSSRENSLVEPYKGTPPISHTNSPRESIAKQASLDESVQMDTPPRSPPEPPPDDEILEMIGVTPVPTQLKERPEMTPRQRWHWAYNQIIMQLNVSIFSIFKNKKGTERTLTPYTGNMGEIFKKRPWTTAILAVQCTHRLTPLFEKS